MAATQQEGQDRIVSTGSSESHNLLAIDTEEKSTSAENLKGQTLTPKDERMVPPSVPHGATFVSPSRNITGQPESLGTGGYPNTVYPPNVYAPQAQPLYFGTGYDNAGGGERDEYTQYLNAEGMELVSPGIYNDNSSLVFHAGYGYTPQMPYGPYSPVTTPIPSVRGDGQMYSPQQFPFAGPYYPQSVPPSMSYITSSTPVSQPDLSISTPIDPQGLDSFGSGGPWSDWSKSQDGQRSLALFSSPAAAPQPLATLGPFSHNAAPLPVGMGSQQQRQMYGFGSTTNSYNRGYMHGGTYQGTNFDGSVSVLGANGRSWITDKSNRRRGRGSGSLCNCNGTLDVLNEQNRGPRALRSKNPTRDSNSSVDAKNNDATLRTRNDLYNRSDFTTDYKDAKFFIIKSYSEDNVHKSIKYGVWASTANGNRKLDAAYHVAKDIHPPCPVFLFFSVNASAQFCGVAEMLGPVDFDKSVDYWQQDKWSGQFPVKWHIIKDVPNSQFRHIILDNNDNKPVTNSRDTQEVKLDQGLQILSIFKNYESDQSILDDFEYYEDREKIMQERKAKQQASLTAGPAVTSHEHRSEGPPGDIIKRMSKSFAQAVRLEESSKEDSLTEKGVPTSAEANQPEGVTKTTGTA